MTIFLFYVTSEKLCGFKKALVEFGAIYFSTFFANYWIVGNALGFEAAHAMQVQPTAHTDLILPPIGISGGWLPVGRTRKPD